MGVTQDLRGRITAAQKQAMIDKAKARLSTLRLIGAAIKDKDIEARAASGEEAQVGDAEVLGILSRMVKQRQESAKAYEEGGRIDLAEAERSEIEIIEEFLPQPLSEAETEAAVAGAIADVGATGIRDMGKVMGALKAQYTGRLDFGAVGPMVKARLCA
ncbi:MAG: GatB/YqeY domain-containing protein [Pseudomonadota bacterium]